MKKFAIISAFLLLVSSCGLYHQLPPTTDQTVVHYVDSIAWHDSTVVTYLTKERYIDIVNPLDTLNLETTYAKAQAYLDTASITLKGTIENKDTVPVVTKIKWKEKIVYRDSIEIKEIPYEVVRTVEVKKFPVTYWIFLGFTILTLVFIGFKIYLKFYLK